MLGWLVARSVIAVTVVEKHGDFLREFRGDTVQPSTLEILAELGLKDRFDALPQHRVEQLDGMFADGIHALGDFRSLRPFPYMALIPQWDLLDLLATAAQSHQGFQLHMRPAVRSEEHTSELQSLMRISYAVFCLKQKNTQTKIHSIN